ncbi:MAG: hypothetical protein ACYTE8_06980, partial [Planctomycetota bacterium]
MTRQFIFQITIALFLLACPWLAEPVLAESTWVIETVDSNAADYDDTSIALDSNDNPHISYFYLKIPDVSVMYAAFNGSEWDIE